MTEVPSQGPFSSGAAREILKLLRKSTKGALLVTTGHRDIRLVVEPRRVSVEAAGYDLSGEGEDSLIRQFLCSLFWEEPSYFLEPEGGPLSNSGSAIRVDANQYDLLMQMDRGFMELNGLRERVKDLDILVLLSANGEHPPATLDSPSAKLFRAMLNYPKGSYLGNVAEEAGLDPIDAAWAVSDLLDENLASIKHPPPTLGIRRLKLAESLADQGLLPAIRYIHLAQGFERSDPKRAAGFYRQAGESFLRLRRSKAALVSLRTSIDIAPHSILAQEGLLQALIGVKQNKEAQSIREKLIAKYLSWNMPCRARRHLEAIPVPSAEQNRLLMESILRMRDFGAATDSAKRILPGLTTEQRVSLVQRFADFGASEAEITRLAGLARLQSMKPVKRFFYLAALAALLAAVFFGADAVFGQRYEEASRKTSAALEAKKFDEVLSPWTELRGLSQQLGMLPSLSKVPPLLEELDRVSQDSKLLEDPIHKATLDWESSKKLSDNERALQALNEAAKSKAFQRVLKKVKTEIKAYRKEVKKEIKSFDTLASHERRLLAGQQLLRDHGKVSELFADYNVTMEINVTPTNATVTWEGFKGLPAELPSSDNGRYQVKLPLRPGSRGAVKVAYKSQGYVAQTHDLILEELKKHVLYVDLIQIIPQARLQIIPKRPGVDKTSGLVVVEGSLDARALARKGLANLQVASSGADLAFLESELQGDELLIVEVASKLPRAANQVYLAGFNMWLERPEAGTASTPLQVTLVSRLKPNGIPRPMAKGQRKLKSVGQMLRFPWIKSSLPTAVQELRRTLK